MEKACITEIVQSSDKLDNLNNTLLTTLAQTEIFYGFLSSFLSILFAGLIITFLNRKFLDDLRQKSENFAKQERWHKIVDGLCEKLEKNVADVFFNPSQDNEKKVALVNYFANWIGIWEFVIHSENLPSDQKAGIKFRLDKLFDFGDDLESGKKVDFGLIIFEINKIRHLLTK